MNCFLLPMRFSNAFAKRKMEREQEKHEGGKKQPEQHILKQTKHITLLVAVFTWWFNILFCCFFACLRHDF